MSNPFLNYDDYEVLEHHTNAICPGCGEFTEWWLYRDIHGFSFERWGDCACTPPDCPCGCGYNPEICTYASKCTLCNKKYFGRGYANYELTCFECEKHHLRQKAIKIYSVNRIRWASHMSAVIDDAQISIIVTETYQYLHKIDTHSKAYDIEWVRQVKLFCITGEYETYELDWDGQEDYETHDLKLFVWEISGDDALSNLPAIEWVSGPYIQLIELDTFNFLQADLPAPKR